MARCVLEWGLACLLVLTGLGAGLCASPTAKKEECDKKIDAPQPTPEGWRSHCILLEQNTPHTIATHQCDEQQQAVIIEVARYMFNTLLALRQPGKKLSNEAVKELHQVLEKGDNQDLKTLMKQVSDGGQVPSTFFHPDVWPEAEANITRLINLLLDPKKHILFACREYGSGQCFVSSMAYLETVRPVADSTKTDPNSKSNFQELRTKLGTHTPRSWLDKVLGISLADACNGKEESDAGRKKLSGTVFGPVLERACTMRYVVSVGRQQGVQYPTAYETDEFCVEQALNMFRQLVPGTAPLPNIANFHNVEGGKTEDSTSRRTITLNTLCRADVPTIGGVQLCPRQFEQLAAAGELTKVHAEYLLRDFAGSLFHELTHACLLTTDLQLKGVDERKYNAFFQAWGLTGPQQLRNAANYELWWFMMAPSPPHLDDAAFNKLKKMRLVELGTSTHKATARKLTLDEAKAGMDKVLQARGDRAAKEKEREQQRAQAAAVENAKQARAAAERAEAVAQKQKICNTKSDALKKAQKTKEDYSSRIATAKTDRDKAKYAGWVKEEETRIATLEKEVAACQQQLAEMAV